MRRLRFSKALNTDSFTNLLAEGTTVVGMLTFTGTQKIQGRVEGDIIDGADKNSVLILDSMSTVTSEVIRANDMILAGKITSKQIRVTDTLRILATANIQGATIYYRTLEIEPGAKIHDCHLVHSDLEEHIPQTAVGISE